MRQVKAPTLRRDGGDESQGEITEGGETVHRAAREMRIHEWDGQVSTQSHGGQDGAPHPGQPDWKDDSQWHT